MTAKRLMQRIFALMLPLALLFSIGVQAAAPAAAPNAEAFALHAEGAPLLPRTQVYDGQLFIDVDPTSWYYSSVVAGYEYGLFNGRGDGFAPNAEITVAELLTLSARIHAAYAGDTIPAAEDGAWWFTPYILYLDEKGILDGSLAGWVNPATRAQLAAIFSLSLPEECYSAPNDALVTAAYDTGNYIADVTVDTRYAEQILWMYRQGLLSGMDDTGSYWPDKTTTRAEVAAVVTRIVDPSLRITPDWAIEVPAAGHSAVGRTLASLVEAPEYVPDGSVSYRDGDAVSALVRQMLASGEHTIQYRYSESYNQSDAQGVSERFINEVKRYCEQMYNTVHFSGDNYTGIAQLAFSAVACTDESLAQYREETMAKAIEVHDMLWETGQLTDSMSQYDVAAVYYRWLCDHCSYDYANAYTESISHIAYAALIKQNAVCDGYTGAYNLFLKLEGIDCYAMSDESHIWTVATLDDVTYHIDVTWGDSESGYADMRFFGMTLEESRRVHSNFRRY